MSNIADAIAPAFTISQLDTLLAWSARRPRGFRVAITADNEWAEEIALISQREFYIYALHPALSGGVHLEMASGRGAWDFDTIDEALVALLEIEEDMEVSWIAGAR